MLDKAKRLQNSRITGPKFIKFLPDVEESRAALTCAIMLRSSHPLWNASAQNKSGGCQFSPNRAKNRQKESPKVPFTVLWLFLFFCNFLLLFHAGHPLAHVYHVLNISTYVVT